jgi:hypothetical protein
VSTPTDPANGATGVTLNKHVTIDWNEDINCTTVNTTNITNTSPGWASISCAGSQAVFRAYGQSYSTSYSTSVTTGVTDKAGNPMTSAHNFSYTTGAPAGAVWYVDGDNSSPASPYSSWATAATDISDATGSRDLAVGDTVIVRASTAGYSAFSGQPGVIVQAEKVGIEYPQVSGTVDFAKGDYVTNPGVIEGFEITENSGKAFNMSNDNTKSTSYLRYNILRGTGKPALKYSSAGLATVEYNELWESDRTGISIQADMGDTTEAWIIRGNNIYDNGNGALCGGTYCGNVYWRNRSYSYILFQNNRIYSSAGRGGVNVTAGNHNLYFTGNEIDTNPYAGIHVSEANTGKIIISGEQNFTFPSSGPSYTNGSPNKIHSNGRGGINMVNDATMDIIKNDIYNNAWGGISTRLIDPDTTYPDFQAWGGTAGGAVLTIRQNYIHGNGTSNTIGGGMTLLNATATIENNVIFENHYAGAQLGDYVVKITNNTVVNNGLGGTIYSDGVCGWECASGALSTPIPIKNNIYAHNGASALFGFKFSNTPGSEERDYNILFDNSNQGTLGSMGDCTASAYPSWLCKIFQYGGIRGELYDPNDYFADPLFMDVANDNYYLSASSPGVNDGSDGTDRGAWGGTYPMDWGTNYPTDWSHSH